MWSVVSRGEGMWFRAIGKGEGVVVGQKREDVNLGKRERGHVVGRVRKIWVGGGK